MAQTMRVAMTHIRAKPWRRSRTMWPNATASAKEITISDHVSTTLVSAVGFSNGWALLALKKPPPLVPSSLIASWNATGPSAMVCRAPSSVVASTVPAMVCGTPAAIRNTV